MNNQVVARFSATLALNHEWRRVIKTLGHLENEKSLRIDSKSARLKFLPSKQYVRHLY
jgi:hypothetical protein